MLTDDYYFYFGLKQLTGLPLVYITYEGSMDKPIVIKQKRNIRVLVDSRIFYSGKWDGYKMLRKTLNMISQWTVSYTHLRAHETGRNLVCRLLLEKKKNEEET